MPQRKHSQQDIEGWGVEDVVHWFTSVSQWHGGAAVAMEAAC